jgi:hypothetical protein
MMKLLFIDIHYLLNLILAIYFDSLIKNNFYLWADIVFIIDGSIYFWKNDSMKKKIYELALLKI